MQALQVTEFNTPPKLVTVDLPEPARGQVRIKVAACGLNFADLLMIKGEYQATPPLPFTLGLEAAGVVDAVGEGVTAFAPGDRVSIFGGQGGLAEYACYPVQMCTKVPESMDLVTAAGFQIAYGTSHLGLTYRAELKAGETLLVLGASGGVGLTAVEIGKALGARVIAVARGADKCAVAQAAGADHVIDSSSTEDLKGALKKLGGVDVLYDPVGGEQSAAAQRAMKPCGRILVIGFASGDVPDFKANHLLVKNIAVHGFYWGAYAFLKPEVLSASLADLFQMHADGRLSPHVGLTAPLAEAPAALEKLRRRETTGKVVITMP
ncbi:MAG: NADPH:quinone oxidoreductase family protein [Pseudomonadota bacterium]